MNCAQAGPSRAPVPAGPRAATLGVATAAPAAPAPASGAGTPAAPDAAGAGRGRDRRVTAAARRLAAGTGAVDRVAIRSNSSLRHATSIARRSRGVVRAPDAVAVADLQRPGQAGALDVTGAAERDRGVGRLAGRRKEHLRIDALTHASGPPGQVLVALLQRPQQSRISSCGGDLVRAWHPRPGHAPTSPVGCSRHDRREERQSRQRRGSAAAPPCRRCVLPHFARPGTRGLLRSTSKVPARRIRPKPLANQHATMCRSVLRTASDVHMDAVGGGATTGRTRLGSVVADVARPPATTGRSSMPAAVRADGGGAAAPSGRRPRVSQAAQRAGSAPAASGRAPAPDRPAPRSGQHAEGEQAATRRLPHVDQMPANASTTPARRHEVRLLAVPPRRRRHSYQPSAGTRQRRCGERTGERAASRPPSRPAR